MPEAAVSPEDPHGAAWHAALIARVLEGDTTAYGELVTVYQPRCLRYACRMLGDRDEAEDVTQVTFVRAFRSLAQCEEPGRFDAWLFSILVNRCRTALEKRARRNRWFADDVKGVEARVEPEAATLFAGTDLTLAQVECALHSLTAAQREAFLLKHVEDMTYDEMAALTGASVSALKMRVSRARELLRAQLAGVFSE